MAIAGDRGVPVARHRRRRAVSGGHHLRPRAPGDFDVVVALLSRSGVDPGKLVAFGRVNVHPRLAIVRTSSIMARRSTSPQGFADAESMIAAVLLRQARRVAWPESPGYIFRAAEPMAEKPQRQDVGASFWAAEPMAEKTEREKAQTSVAENRKAFPTTTSRDVRGGAGVAGDRGEGDSVEGASTCGKLCPRRGREVFLYNVTSARHHRGYCRSRSLRRRKLLLHRSEIRKLIGKTVEKGMTLVPVRLVFQGRRVKVAVSLAKGKQDSTTSRRSRSAKRPRKTRAGEGAQVTTRGMAPLKLGRLHLVAGWHR